MSFHILRNGPDKNDSNNGNEHIGNAKKVLTFLLSVLTSDWLKQQKLTKLHNAVHISSRIFENIPQNGPEYSYRKLAIASFLVAAVRKNIGGLLSWLVSLSSSVPELTRHGLERGLHVKP